MDDTSLHEENEVAKLEAELATVMANFEAETERARTELNTLFAETDALLTEFANTLEHSDNT